ncbi:Pre-mRNA cleavage complex II Clp1, partial [Cynara cardunculus var. scolymus]
LCQVKSAPFRIFVEPATIRYPRPVCRPGPRGGHGFSSDLPQGRSVEVIASALQNHCCGIRSIMAFGGPPLGPAAAAGSSPAIKQVKLEKESELRIEIFTWYGATIEMQDNTETVYVADETPMVSYVNVHAVLEGRRNRAKASASDADASQGPRVIVVGPTDSGKSTLSRMLLSWAAKQGWKPTFVDLDIGQGSITLPGCIAASPIDMPIDPVEGIPLEMPLVYFYGHNTPTVNADLYRVLVKELAVILERQFAGNTESRAAGMLLLHAIDTFQATVVLVLGQEKLCSMLRDVLKRKPNVDVVKLQRSGGVVSRNSKFRASARSQRIREYFYGLSNDLSPHSSIASFSDLAIYKIGGGPQAPASALPIGAQPVADPMRLVPVNINRDLLNLVLAVSFAKEQDQILSRYCQPPSDILKTFYEENNVSRTIGWGTSEQILVDGKLNMDRNLKLLIPVANF